jgi:REP element-mobilizing transposase RayT
MSRLRRLILSDRYFFVTCASCRGGGFWPTLNSPAIVRVVAERRRKHGFLLSAWVFLPDHWHAILFPRHPLTISGVMESIKVGSTLRINTRRNESGLLWQPRFFDRTLRSERI